jgi:hypothetical protein
MDCVVDRLQHSYEWTLCERVSGSSVLASITQRILQSYVGDGRVDWRMRLQRWEPVAPGQPHGGYVTIGTRTGYVSPSSPSNREFTGVRSTSRSL